VRFERARAARPADEIDALVGARVMDVEQRREQMVCKEAHVQPCNRIVDRNEARVNEEPIPPAREIHAELARRGGAHRLIGRRDRETRAQLGNELLRAAAVQIA